MYKALRAGDTQFGECEVSKAKIVLKLSPQTYITYQRLDLLVFKYAKIKPKLKICFPDIAFNIKYLLLKYRARIQTFKQKVMKC